MDRRVIKKSIEIGGYTLTIETGKLAQQANGAVTVRLGDSVLFSAVCGEKRAKDGQDFFPLTVDYRERFCAAGKFPGGYIKKETRQSDKEILTSRLTDRPLRPLFPEGFYNDVQISNTVLSADDIHDPDVLSIIAASCALHISDIPFLQAVGGVRVGKIESKLVINPTYAEMEKSSLDLMLAGTQNAILMIEGYAHEYSEDEMLEAVYFGHEQIKRICALQDEIRAEIGKSKMAFIPAQIDAGLEKQVKEFVGKRLENAILIRNKMERNTTIANIKKETSLKFVIDPKADDADKIEKNIIAIVDKMESDITRSLALEKGIRSDGRGVKDIRPIWCEIERLPCTHGTAVFTRGETQVLMTAAIGTATDGQRVENFLGENVQTFMLNYNFPAFSVGEVRASRGPGRREIGHGKLAEKALNYVLPSQADFPYTIRLVSDVLESNGSSSMATVCSGSLALMDAGVPVKAAVAGIAMGLILEGNQFVILSDILGSEDHLGDMDFKVAGTAQGITAFQLDIKVEGITSEIMRRALEQAREGRLHILNIMQQTIAEPRKELAGSVPRVTKIKINPSKIGLVIGQGGKTIKKIIEETGAQIDIADDGTVSIASSNAEQSAKAVQFISNLTEDVEIGKVYEAKVRKIVDFGCFVELNSGKEGLVHISQLANYRVDRVADVVKEGDSFSVKCISIDDMGRLNFSRKAVLVEQNV